MAGAFSLRVFYISKKDFAMKTNFSTSRTVGGLLLLLAVSSAHSAGVLEQILANPRVQAMLGKPTEVVSALNLCKNDSYRASNQQACADAVHTDNVLKLPIEMRTVMSYPQSAQSLRDLCLAAQTTAQRGSYLCVELLKADSTFASAVNADQANRMLKSIMPQNTDRN
jgi:hypothetical protein